MVSLSEMALRKPVLETYFFGIVLLGDVVWRKKKNVLSISEMRLNLVGELLPVDVDKKPAKSQFLRSSAAVYLSVSTTAFRT